MTTPEQRVSKRVPKIALWDIETAPNLSWIWGKWEQNALDTQVPGYFLCFAWKWLDEAKITTYALPDYPAFKRCKEDDKALIKQLWRLLDEADIVIAHNGDAFDIKKANARFLSYGLPPPSPYKTIDTLKIARRYFKFDSNKLDDLGKSLGVGRKLPHTGFHLWRGCMAGDEKSWTLMRKYNAQDVKLLERVYERLKPWAQNHPDLRIYEDRAGCPSCLSPQVQRRGFRIALKKKRQSYHCQNCGHWFCGGIIKD